VWADVEYRLSTPLSLCLTTGYAERAGGFAGGDSRGSLTFGARYAPWPSRLRPVVRGGVGGYRLEGGEVHLGWNLGLAADYLLRPDLALEAGVELHEPGGRDDRFVAPTVGLIFRR
jgi:hypothetical protein